MQVSYSRVEAFEKCPFKYKLRYDSKLLTIPSDNADNSLILGQALHTGLEKGVDVAINEYFMSYNVIDDKHINEVIKLEELIPKAVKMLQKGKYEVEINNEHFIGFIDLLTPNEDGTFDIYDFKYSNNVSNYKCSSQLHLYKYFWEKQTGNIIKNIYFLFVPKVQIRQKKSEDLFKFRKRLKEELSKVEPELVKIEFDYNKVIEFMFKTKMLLEAIDFPKNESYLCNWCEYQEYCQKGYDYMLLPKNERRNIEKIEKKVVWLYGAPFSGKTTFANKFPDPLMLNTDGNIKFVDAPYIAIKDNVNVEGRITKRKLAWETFKEAIAELEKKNNNFKSIIVDLIEDTYEHCRLYMYDQMGISHESDDSFRAWDKVRTEFLSTLKKLMALDYENIILISHEDTSKDITKKSGDKITSIKPNLQDKAANKVAGMVDIVARVIADDSKRVLSFKTNEVIFGGGRLKTARNQISLDYDEFIAVYEEANKNVAKKLKCEETKKADDKNVNSNSESELDNKQETSLVDDKVKEEVKESIVKDEEDVEVRTRKRKVRS